MIYNSAKIKQLFDSIEDNLTEEQQSILKTIVSNYNKLYIFAKEKSAELEEKRKIYLKESEENEKLRQKNAELKRLNNSLQITNLVFLLIKLNEGGKLWIKMY